ncbi:MAG: hypothetical protein KBI32_00270 [Phycisphaerae bacterium]|nr:hypothetical protein [Phycisphaerae bacterium]
MRQKTQARSHLNSILLMALLFGVAQEIMGRLARATDSMQFSRTDFVCNLTLDEQEVVRLAGPQFIVNTSQSPNYPGPWYQRGFLSIWNQAWFSCLRSASGLYRFARDTQIADKIIIRAASADKIKPSMRN